jgi:hypothetical protein
MKSIRTFAILVLLSGLFAWFGAGAHRGWTRTSVAVKTVDEVTGIEGITYQRGFVPGIDFIGAAAGISAVLFGISCLLPRKKAALV